jgi:hypothetical protein
MIIGNRAAHAGDKATGFNFASTICGFIVTDKPVITMSPQPVVVAPGDNITWSGYACGAPPLSYQWQRDGIPVAGATSTAFSITNVSAGSLGNYVLVVSNLYGVATSSTVSVDKLTAAGGNNFTLDSNPNATKQDGLVNGATWVASNSDSAGTNRIGVMSFNGTNSDQIIVSGATNFDSATGTVMFWMRSAGIINTNDNPATLYDRLNGNGLAIFQNADGSLALRTSGNPQDLSSTGSLSDDKWHHVAATFDQGAGGEVDLYIDGQLSSSGVNNAAWSWQPGQEIELGLSHNTNSFQAFNGWLDDVRIYNRVLTAAEVGVVFTSGDIVDGSALSMRLDFEAAPTAGVTLRWQSSDSVLQSADKVDGPYTDVPGAVSPYPAAQRSTTKFYRYHGHVPQDLVSNPFLM